MKVDCGVFKGGVEVELLVQVDINNVGVSLPQSFFLKVKFFSVSGEGKASN